MKVTSYLTCYKLYIHQKVENDIPNELKLLQYEEPQ